jgi:N-hydroxyarylamine O-acetyltransferase
MALDLAAYAARVEYAGDFRPDVATLRALHLAHATHIPFENIDVLLGRPTELDLGSLERKLIHGRRGGYCFEHNTLFAAVLEECGFPVTRLAARVRWGAPEGAVRPRSHMLLALEAEGETWLADVGFGGEGLLWPLPLRPGATAAQFDWKYRVASDGPYFVLQAGRPEGWLDLYSFTLEAQYPVDYQVANWYTSTHPKSMFRNTLLAQMPAPEVRRMLWNRKWIETTAGGTTERILESEEELMEVLRGAFGLHFPPGTRIPLAQAGNAA